MFPLFVDAREWATALRQMFPIKKKKKRTITPIERTAVIHDTDDKLKEGCHFYS